MSSLRIISNQFNDFALEIKRNIDLFPKSNSNDYIEDSFLNSLALFLKDNYNNLLLAIEQLYSINPSLIELRKEIIRKSSFGFKAEGSFSAQLMKVSLNKAQLKSLISDLQSIREAQKRQKANFALLNNRRYPSIKEMNQLSDQFEEIKQTQLNEMNKRNRMLKKKPNPKSIHRQSLNNTFEVQSEASPLCRYEEKELGFNVNSCKDICREINERLAKYCTCVSYPKAVDHMKEIKADNKKIEDSILFIKSEMKDLLKGANEIHSRVDKFQKENNAIVALNNSLHSSINFNTKQNNNQSSPFITWETHQEKPLIFHCNSNKSIVLLTSKPFNNPNNSSHSSLKQEERPEANQRDNQYSPDHHYEKRFLLKKPI